MSELAQLSNVGVKPTFRLMHNPLQRSTDWVVDEVTPQGTETYFVIPALAIPLRTKATFSCPESHVTALRDLIPAVDHIVTIGWKAGEPDFVAMLADVESHTTVTVVNRTADSRALVRKTLSDAGVPIGFNQDDGAKHSRAFAEFIQTNGLAAALSLARKARR
jgi:hypothetical protein